MFWKLIMGSYDWIWNTFSKEIWCITTEESYLLFTWAGFKQVCLLLVQIMQNLAGGCVLKDLTHSRELRMPCPWKCSSPGWTWLWAPSCSWRCAGWLQVGRGLGDLYRSLPAQTVLGFDSASQTDSGNSWWVHFCYSSSPSSLTAKWS